MEFIGIGTAAERWNLSERRIRILCSQGRIRGAKKEQGDWLIPAAAQKPKDMRRRNVPTAHSGSLLPLPIGISDFKETVTHYYYADKTLMIKDILDARPKVSLFTRPRRFGKTLCMDMLRTFFEKTPEDTSRYFQDKKIWSCGEKYTSHQGQYPVIFMTFKDIKFLTWEDTLNAIKQVIRNEYGRHGELMDSARLNPFEKSYYNGIIQDQLPESSFTSALGMLSQCLFRHHGRQPVIIIDEYDTPIQQGHLQNFYEKIVLFMRNFFSSGVKDNANLSFAFMTGILKVAKESIFSGMNNLKVNSILDDRYSEYFGFTREEICIMLDYYGKSDRLDEICEWYDGYLFGCTEIFNPWSVLNYLDDNCFPKAFWQATGSNDIIREIISNATPEILENMQLLLQGKSISTYVDLSVIYPEIQNNPATIYSFLLIAGYLKIVQQSPCYDGNAICDVAIPNKEISYVYEKEILTVSDVITQSTAIAIQQAVIKQDAAELQKQLQTYLTETISTHDAASESFYHGLVIGLCAAMNNLFYVSSNRESGMGRYDIQLVPQNMNMPGVLIELKVLREQASPETIHNKLAVLADKALEQIDEKDYAASMRRVGIRQILKFGIAFWKKEVELICRMEYL